MRYWLRYEILDLEVVSKLISNRTNLEKRMREMIRQLREDVTDLQKLQKGSTSFQTLFNSKEHLYAKTQRLKMSIPQQEIEIMNLRHFLVLVSF